jgi:hypothetical protein
VVAFTLYEANHLRSESFSSTYVYEITLQTDTTLWNMTLILPLPEISGGSPILDALRGGNVYGKPETWDTTVVEKNGVKMLQIYADVILPVYHPLPVPISKGESTTNVLPESTMDNASSAQVPIPVQMVITVISNHRIDTRTPIGHEPLFSPRFNSTEVECSFPYDKTSGQINCFEYESVLYSSCDAESNATVSIDISLIGRNEWWLLGWSFNEYRDHIYTELRPDRNHGQIVRGELIQGIGSYS